MQTVRVQHRAEETHAEARGGTRAHRRRARVSVWEQLPHFYKSSPTLPPKQTDTATQTHPYIHPITTHAITKTHPHFHPTTPLLPSKHTHTSSGLVWPRVKPKDNVCILPQFLWELL